MIMLIRQGLTLFLLFISVIALGQLSADRCRWVPAKESFMLDSMSVLPSSIKVSYPSDTTLRVSYDLNTGMAAIDNAEVKADSILVCYQIFPLNFSGKYFKRDLSLYDTNHYYREKFDYNEQYYPISGSEQIFNTPGISKSGSITRGVSFGNNQNVFVNSALNLQLDGKITDDIGITASISDQNIPFQPEGNTQQLQEFDKVFIQLHTPKSKLTAGDLVMRNQPGYFLKYYRNVQGGLFEGNYVKDSSTYSLTTAGAAVSKGKFASIQLTPLEGVQGPYRLIGPNNERFIIVLANSERVYVDGKELTRGFDYDYTIDYNQAEITFTARTVITKYSVIRVDFEYSDKNYGRANFVASHYQTVGKFQGYVNYYLQRDNPNNPLLFNLTAEDRNLLADAGDNLSNAVINGVDSTGFQENKILYRRVDSLGTEVYEYSTEPSEAVYEVVFTFVGLGNGDYEPLNNTSNGKVYTYEGLGNGSYLPVRVVPTPKKNQMITVGGIFSADKQTEIFAELAFSEEDQNLYSDLDNSDNSGKAIKVGMVNRGRQISWLGMWKFINSFDFEFTERNFRRIDRFRDVNYERDWSADLNSQQFNRVFNASLGIQKDRNNSLRYSVSHRVKGAGEVDGLQQDLNLNKSFGRFQVNSNAWWMFNDRQELYSDWKRFNLNINRAGKFFTPGIVYTMDKNSVTNDQHEVISTAMYFDELKVYVKSKDSASVSFFSDFAIRQNGDTLNGEIKTVNQSRTLNSGFNARIRKKHDIHALLTYRYLDYFSNFQLAGQDEETFITRVDWNSDFLSRHIRSELTITTGTGRELKREFFYQAVPQGTGTHIWEDFNEDGIQDLNEFIEKVPGLPYNQQEFIRVFSPTDEYVNAYTGTFVYRLDLFAPRNWRTDKKFIKSFISRFSSTSSWTINKKVLEPDLWQRFNPSESSENLNTLSSQKALRANLFYNRTNPIYGMDILYASSQSKSLLTQGFESIGKEESNINGRVNIKQVYNINIGSGRGVKRSASDFLSQRNFLIESYFVRPELAFQPANNIRLTGNFNFLQKTNIQEGGGEKSVFYEGGMDLRYSKVTERTITGNFKYIKIFADLNETPVASTIGYEMLDGLRPGNNFTWSINWQEKLLNGLQLSFIYEGRKSEGSNTIHTGRMQASAFF